jgi:hypothetical protein
LHDTTLREKRLLDGICRSGPNLQVLPCPRFAWRTDAGGVCQVPLYIKLSDEVGTWAGDISEAKLPDRFLVDYVRVYDLVDK